MGPTAWQAGEARELGAWPRSPWYLASRSGSSDTLRSVSILETTLVFVAIPLAIYGFFALTTLRSNFASKPRYRPGQPWDYPPVWWSANPEGLGEVYVDGRQNAPSKVRGGARGNW